MGELGKQSGTRFDGMIVRLLSRLLRWKEPRPSAGNLAGCGKSVFQRSFPSGWKPLLISRSYGTSGTRALPKTARVEFFRSLLGGAGSRTRTGVSALH